MTLALCIVGCGNYARRVAKAISSLDEHVELFFASRDRNKAKDYSGMFGGKDFFGSYEEAAGDVRVQALYFVTPHHLHCENALMAARHSKHILVEKPIARTLEEARRMISAARDASVKLMVAENARFLPVIMKCKELLNQGTIGPLRLVQVQAEQPHVPTDWRSSLEITGGGALIDGGIHAIDNLVYLAGMPTSLYANTLPKSVHHLEGEDGMAVMARMADGVVGLINFSWGNAISPGSAWLSITGASGRIHIDIGKARLVLDTAGEQKEFQFTPGDYGWKEMVIEFAESVRQDRPPLVSGEEGMRDLAVVLKAYESARTGLPVTL